jgi:hypothetical protein
MKRAKVVSITIMHAVQFGVATLIALTVSVSHAQETRVLYANSLCKYPMRIMVHHKDSQSDHHTHAWYFFGPYEENRLVANDIVLRQVVGESLYVYAETLEGRLLIWEGRDAKTSFKGVYYNLRRVPLTVNQRGELEFKFTCPD